MKFASLHKTMKLDANETWSSYSEGATREMVQG